MAFIESPRFPDGIAYNAIGGPTYNTSIVVVKSGAESRNAGWSAARHKYDVSQAAKTKADFDLVAAFFRNVQGRATGFRFRDFSDFKTTFSEGTLGTGNGTPGPFQMQKKYSSGGNNALRTISKPVTGTCSFKLGANPITIGIAAGNISVDYTKGTITFVESASVAAASVTAGSLTQISFATKPGNLAVNEYIWLQDFAGADAGLLNNKSHKIGSITGSGPYTYTVTTDTTGKTIALGTGKGKKFPQPADALTWEGEFDVPCRFDTDELKAEILAPNIFRWDGIPLVETRDI